MGGDAPFGVHGRGHGVGEVEEVAGDDQDARAVPGVEGPGQLDGEGLVEGVASGVRSRSLTTMTRRPIGTSTTRTPGSVRRCRGHRLGGRPAASDR